jgi:hypothetical protein
MAIIVFSFITVEYDSSYLKENGTIPFYRRFFQHDQRDAGPSYQMLVGLALPRRPNFNPPSLVINRVQLHTPALN